MSLSLGRPKTQRLEVPGSFSPPGHGRRFSSGASSASGSVAGSAINAARKKSSLHSGARRHSLRGKGGKLGGRRISIAGCLETEAGDMLEPPGPPTTQAAAWQMKTDTVMQRVTLLFNCQTMSDVVFHVGMHQIPAHKFVLACSSPVLYQRLLQANAIIPDNASAEGPNEKFSRMMLAAPSEGRAPSFAGSVCRESRRGGGDYDGGQSVVSGMTGLRQGGGEKGYFEEEEDEEALNVTHVEVRERYEDFFELLRFLYCDEVALSLKNVVPLIFMSEEFKLPALSERCLAYLRAEVRPEGALQILGAVRVLMSKAVMSLWRDIVSKNKALRAYKEMNLVERKRRLAALRAGSMSDTASVRSGATSARRAPARRSGSKDSAFHGSEASFSQFAESEQGGALTDASGLGAAEAAKIAAGTRQAKYATFEKSLYRRLTLLSEELWERCWRNIREHTEAVLAGDDWLDQSLRTVRAVLSIDTCNISEAQLFRHLNRWVENQCRKSGYPLVPEYRKKVLGEGTLELIRFPVMKLEEVLWEVVPAGVLTYEEVHSLQAAIVNGTSVMKRFNGEPRQRPLHDLMQEAKDDGGDSNGRHRAESLLDDDDSDDDGRRRKRSSFSSVASSADQKELHAILGSRLWRSHVDTFCEDQEEQGLAFEAIEACRARDAAGSQRDLLFPKQPHGAAPSHRPTRPKTAPPSATGGTGASRRGSLQSQVSNSASGRGAQRMQRLTRFRPAISRRPGSVSPMLMHGQSLRAEAAVELRTRPALSTSPAGSSPSPGASPSPTGGRSSPLLLANNSNNNNNPTAPTAAGTGSGAPAPLAPRDFESAGASGLYRFRGERALEVRLIGGAPYAVDYGAIGSAVEASQVPEVGERLGLDLGLDDDDDEVGATSAESEAARRRELSAAMWQQACGKGISLAEAKQKLYLARMAKAEALAEPLDAFINASSVRVF